MGFRRINRTKATVKVTSPNVLFQTSKKEACKNCSDSFKPYIMPVKNIEKGLLKGKGMQPMLYISTDFNHQKRSSNFSPIKINSPILNPDKKYSRAKLQTQQTQTNIIDKKWLVSLL